MTPPLTRVRRGAMFLGWFFVVGSAVHFLVSEQGTLLDSIYWFVITITGVGYGETSQAASDVKIWTIVVIAVGMSAAAYVIGALIQIMTEGEIARVLGVRRMTREIDSLSDHVIICGYGRTGRMLAEDLSSQRVPLVVVELTSERVSAGQDAGLLAIQGDATREDVLRNVGIERAQTLVSALQTDAENVFLTLTARNLNADIQIIARGKQPTSEKKLLQAGADRVVMPALIGARRISTLVTRPHMASLIESVTEDSQLDVSLEEIAVVPSSQLVNKTVRDAEAHKRHGLLVVAIRRADGEMLFNPDADDTFLVGDTLIVMGKRDSIDQFHSHQS